MGMDRFAATLRSRRRALAPLLLAGSLLLAVPPGVALPMHPLLVTSATGVRAQLKAGQGLIAMVNQPHYGTNNGTDPAEIGVVYAWVKGQPFTVLEPTAGRAR
jgi:hypothetical protein